MFHQKIQRRKIIIYFFCFICLFITVAYATLNTKLNIDGVVVKKGGLWEIQFTNLSVASLNGLAQSKNERLSNTTIQFDGTLFQPLDSITYKFNVRNNGSIDAVVSSIQYLGVEQANKSNISYLFTYANGDEIKIGDKLPYRTSKQLKLTIMYNDVDDLSSNDVNLSFGANIVYVQAENSIIDNPKDDLDSTTITSITLGDPTIKDDTYLFSGNTYYLNPYNLNENCNSSNYVQTPTENINSCMKWYEVSEDDVYLTLMLNANIGEPIENSSDITATSMEELISLTKDWDNRLILPTGSIVDNQDYSGKKSRMISVDELAYIIEDVRWVVGGNKTSHKFDTSYHKWLFDNFSEDSWRQGAYVTSTKYDTTRNWVLSKETIDVSEVDGYTCGIRPVIMVRKDILKNAIKEFKHSSNVTYLPTSMISSKTNSNEKYIEYQIKKMRASGVNRVFLNVGKVELTKSNDIISFTNTLDEIYEKYSDEFARWLRVGRLYNVEIIPWINYSMNREYYSTNYDDNKTWGDVVNEFLGNYVNKILSTGYYCDDDNRYYIPSEIHYDGEPTRTSYQPYFLKTIQTFRNVIQNRARLSISSAAGNTYSSSYLQELANYVDEFDVMIYSSMGPSDSQVHNQQDYINYIQNTINIYTTSLNNTNAKIYAVAPMYEDTYRTKTPGWPDSSINKVYEHLNFIGEEEVETINVFLNAISDHSNKIDGLGIYNWIAYTLSDTAYNRSSFMNENYNYKTVVNNYLKRWVYN